MIFQQNLETSYVRVFARQMDVIEAGGLKGLIKDCLCLLDEKEMKIILKP